ncbi:Hypothetical predicted protein [Octopus vulgaris]|uniref:Uncharacterized protein n=1 Tax=Octopus vulgaris TaxID=6645 RepID=A0AA36ASZ3_OCTVU|nr:Hypothetical predicted protein [Octopus vulgaris]
MAAYFLSKLSKTVETDIIDAQSKLLQATITKCKRVHSSKDARRQIFYEGDRMKPHMGEYPDSRHRADHKENLLQQELLESG